ncbi:hypothetical protein SAMN04487972_11714 [Paracoccus halophilus]|uniref:Uncharacterized protein n=1 Tax=Paracoccus halophilus TaxID=376733 RepID=A0A099F0L2_9RHOB|nr:hypothetical protein [Paracoccus halophilus]KGJ03692.1 hypothetical protein IT41_12965 [Paracoccus halophilus]SFA57230.1 hypothetical protein SAMN04487972_11714 [Paracoccus halophilus]
MSLADHFGFFALAGGRARAARDSLQPLRRQISALHRQIRAEHTIPVTMEAASWQAGYLSLWGDMPATEDDEDEPDKMPDDLEFF